MKKQVKEYTVRWRQNLELRFDETIEASSPQEAIKKAKELAQAIDPSNYKDILDDDGGDDFYVEGEE